MNITKEGKKILSNFLNSFSAFLTNFNFGQIYLQIKERTLPTHSSLQDFHKRKGTYKPLRTRAVTMHDDITSHSFTQ